MWTVSYDERLEEWLQEIPSDIKARVLRIVDMLVQFGPGNAREPYVRSVKGYKKLFEIRAKGKDGIARVFYYTHRSKTIVLLHGFTKKTAKTPQREIEVAIRRMKEYPEWQE
jgi:phage-related protein